MRCFESSAGEGGACLDVIQSAILRFIFEVLCWLNNSNSAKQMPSPWRIRAAALRSRATAVTHEFVSTIHQISFSFHEFRLRQWTLLHRVVQELGSGFASDASSVIFVRCPLTVLRNMMVAVRIWNISVAVTVSGTLHANFRSDAHTSAVCTSPQGAAIESCSVCYEPWLDGAIKKTERVDYSNSAQRKIWA